MIFKDKKKHIKNVLRLFYRHHSKPTDQLDDARKQTIEILNGEEPLEDLLLIQIITSANTHPYYTRNMSKDARNNAFENYFLLFEKLKDNHAFKKYSETEPKVIDILLDYALSSDHIIRCASLFPFMKLSPSRIVVLPKPCVKELYDKKLISDKELFTAFDSRNSLDSLMEIIDLSKNLYLLKRCVRKGKNGYWCQFNNPAMYAQGNFIKFFSYVKEHNDLVLDLSAGITKNKKDVNYIPYLICLRDFLPNDQIKKNIMMIITSSKGVNKFLARDITKVFPEFNYLVAML